MSEYRTRDVRNRFLKFGFGFEKNRGFGLGKNHWFGSTARDRILLLQRGWRAQLLSQDCTVLTVLSTDNLI